ncbi:MAG: SGNH/GDSL hydrolase family protein [Anaerovoracaceae bacterium]
MKRVKRIAGTIGFILIFLLLLSEVSGLVMHKQIEGRWNMTAKVAGFYNEEPDSFDVLFLGSSHMYCSVDPAVFQEETGLSSYVFATQQQPLWITYHYMVEALKIQHPQQIAVEIHMAIQTEDYLDEGTNHSAIDPIPMSENKLKMISASVPEGERRYYIFNIMKYHDRWEELEKEDFVRTFERTTDPDKGFVRLTEISKEVEWEDVSDVTKSKVGTEKNMEYLNKIVDLAEEEDIPLLLFKSPSNATVEEKTFYNGVAELAAQRGLAFIDFNDAEHYQEIGLDIKEDFYDQRHLNEAGMRKFVPYFSTFLLH